MTDNTVHYTVTISTSDLPGAGTDCTAYIVIYGADENTGKRALEAAEGRFLRGSVQACQVAGLHVSKMTHVCIGHNDDGMFSSNVSSVQMSGTCASHAGAACEQTASHLHCRQQQRCVPVLFKVKPVH